MLNKFSDSKLEHLYIISEDSNVNIRPYSGSEKDLIGKIKSEIKTEFSLDEIKIINGIRYLNLETLNIIEKNVKENRKKDIKSDNLAFKKLNREKLTTIFKCLGFNIIYCPQIAEDIYNNLSILISLKYFDSDSDKNDCIKSTVVVKQSIFYCLAKGVIKALTGTKCRIRKYFNLSYLIISKSIPIVILLGGTSGTGKSTVSSLVASRLGISTVLSTDTIRHIMRNFLSKEEVPVLFASTYEAYKYIDNKNTGNSSNIIMSEESLSKKVLRGYCEQSKIVGEKLIKVIENILRRRESIIIEGVHLTIENIKSIMKIYNYTFPFLIYIDKAEKHKERFAVRSKLMTLDPRYNKYVEHFEHIRTIQNFLAKKADIFLLPKIDNTNVDKSIGMIQETILRSFKDTYTNSISNYDESNDNLNNYFNNFSKLKKTLLSSKEANILISQKVNKYFLFEKFFSNCNEDIVISNTETTVMNNITTTKGNNNFNNNFNNDLFDSNQFDNTNFDSLLKDIRIQTSEINLSRKSSNMKKECLSDEEIIFNSKNSIESQLKKNQNKELANSSSSRNRINYMMEEHNNRNNSNKNLKKVFSARTHKPKQKKMEFEDKDSNASVSFHKLGSIDSESVNERIKVINETEDELESFDGERDYTRSNVSCASISEDDEKNESEFFQK